MIAAGLKVRLATYLFFFALAQVDEGSVVDDVRNVPAFRLPALWTNSFAAYLSSLSACISFCSKRGRRVRISLLCVPARSSPPVAVRHSLFQWLDA